FFFQAEDGIRDGHVTGSDVCSSDLGPGDDRVGEPVGGVVAAGALDLRPAVVAAGFDYVDLVEPVLAELRREEGAVFVPGESLDRSEERRVGKDCRARESAYRAERAR